MPKDTKISLYHEKCTYPKDLKNCKSLCVLVFFTLLFFGGLIGVASAQTLSLDMGAGGGSFTGRMIQFLLVITILSLAPSILMMVTSFLRMVVVLSFLRSALGLQQSPPNTVLVSLALFLTVFVMAPTLQKAYEEGIAPYIEEKIDDEEAFKKTAQPLQMFMLRHVREKDLELFMGIAQIEEIKTPEETPLRVLIPSFMISELRRAFEIGFLIFLPFLVIDMVVASVLMSMGMMMVPPMMISLPFKVIFFVLVDGWHMVVGSLVKGFSP